MLSGTFSGIRISKGSKGEDRGSENLGVSVLPWPIT